MIAGLSHRDAVQNEEWHAAMEKHCGAVGSEIVRDLASKV